MKLHLPKALAAAVMALFAIPNALADVTVTETSTLTKGVDYFLPSGSKGDIVLTLADGFSSVAAGTTLVTAKAETTGTQTMEIVTAGSGAFRGKANGSNYGTAGTNAPSGSSVTVRFDKDNGAFVYDGMTTTTKLMEESGLRYSATIGGAYSYSVAETDVITSATFADSSVGIIKNLSGSGDLTSTKSFLIIEGGTTAENTTGSSEINYSMSGKALSITGFVALGNITSSSAIGSGIFVASGASLSTQSITCAYSPGDMIIHGELNNAGNLILTSGTQNTTNLKGAGTLTVASILTHNGGRLNSSLANVHVTGNVDLGGATITEGQPATGDILTVSGGVFTVDGTTTVRSGRSFNISGGTTTLTGAATVDGTMTVSGGTNTLGALSVGGTMTVSNGTTTATSVTVTDGGVLKLVTEGGRQSKLRATNGLTVQSGGQLQFTAKDVTGYDGGSTSLKKITIENGGSLWLNHTTNETFAGELNLAGTLKGNGSSTQWDFFNNSTLNVADNVSTAKVENLTIRLRSGATKFTIGNASTLTIGDIQIGTDFGAANTLTVTGAGNGCGTLVVTGTATLNNLSVSGTSGAVSFGGATTLNDLTISGASGAVSFGGATTLNNLTISGTSGTGSFGGATTTLNELTVSGASGAVSFTGSTLSAAKIHTSGNNASVTIGDDTHNVVATVGRFELGDSLPSGDASLLTIASGSKVIVTGNDTAGNDAYKNVGILLGEWNNSTTAQIAGNLVAADASIQAGNKGYTAVISETGLVAVKGLYSSKGTGAVALTLNGGKLILGENGVQRGTVTLNGGTVGSSFTATDTASMTIAGSVVLSESSSTVFDTNLYSLNTTSGQDSYGTVSRSEATGTTITVTGGLSGEGTVRVIGNGILTLAGNIDVGAIEGAGITNITGQIVGGDVQDVNILATQDRMGTATLSGTINFDLQNGTFRHGDETYSITTGIKKVTRELLLLDSVDATQFTGATFKVNGADGSGLTIDTNGIRGTFTSDTTTYLIADSSDEISWSTVQEAGCESVEFSAGGKLTMSSTDIVNSSAIKVQDGVKGSSLSGSGKYVLSSGSADIKVDSLTDWTGTVKLSGRHTKSLDLGSSKLGNTGSTILLNGVTAEKLADATVDANVKLDSSGDDGLTITGTGATVTFNGNVTGVLTGDKTAINIINRASGTTLNFAGEENKDVQIIDESGSTISFSGKATDISTSIVSQMDNTVTSVSFDNTAAVSMSGDILNDKWSSQNAKGDLSVNLNENTKVTFSGTVHANTLNVESGAEASFTKDAKLDAMVGSGILKASGGATTSVEDASGFTGTLMSTNGSLQIQKASSLAAIDSASTGGIWLTDSASRVTVDEIVLSGSMVGVYYIPSDGTSPSAESTVITGSLTVSGTSTSTLRANLELKENSMLKLDSALAMGGTLTLNSGITLANTGYVHISDITKNTEITLFSSVNSVTYGADSTALTSTEVDAHNVFGNLNTGDFTIRFDNGDVILKANNNVPEPTTATLSLLALMGLAARRRRKAAK